MLGVVQDVMKETTGINLKEIVESNAPNGRNQLVDKLPDEPTNPADEAELAIEEV